MSTTTIMDKKLSNAMLEIQATNNIVFLPTALSLKNVIASSSNEKVKE
jgi:hypothetical protein